MERKWIAAALVMGLTMVSGAARADENPKRQCIADARAERKACSQVCNDDFLSAVDACRGLNHDCVEEARDARATCVSDVLHALGQCVEDTCDVFDTLIAQCKAANPAGSHARNVCIDGVQLQKFQCRDDCRESVELFKSLKACRDEFKADAKACTPPPALIPMGP